MRDITTIGVIGAGGWGTALAIAANRAGSNVILHARDASVIHTIEATRMNAVYLPDCFIDPEITVTDDLHALRDCDFLILAVPAQRMRTVAISLSDMLDMNTPLVIASKGIEQTSAMLMHEVLRDILPKNPVLAISGPNFAGEVAKGLPAATTVACEDEALANQFIYAVGGKLFRPYYTDDIVSTQIGGAVKNVIAIACGIAMGCGFGENARAALITRGLAEMMRLAEAKGGRRENLVGLAGIGDLVLTCGSAQSRNFSYGYRLGKQQSHNPEEEPDLLVEGVSSAESVFMLARKLGVSMPLCAAIHRIIYERLPIGEAITELLERPFVMDVERSSIA